MNGKHDGWWTYSPLAWNAGSLLLAAAADPDQQTAAYLASQAVSNLATNDIVASGSDGALTPGNATLGAGTIALQPGGVNIAAASQLEAAAGGGGRTPNVDIGTAAPSIQAAQTASTNEFASPTGSLWLGSFNGVTGSTVNQITALGLDGTSATGTTDIANVTMPGDAKFFNTSSVAVDPARGTVFVLDTFANTDAVIYSVPSGGGPATAFYTAPDTGANGDPGSLGAIVVDEQDDSVVFTQGDFIESTGAQIPTETGVFSVPETGGAPTQLVEDVDNGTTLDNPTSLALDLPDNLAIFVDNDAFSGGSGDVVIYAGSLTSHDFTPLLTFNVGTVDFPNTALAVDPASDTIYYSVADFGTVSSYGIFSIHYSPDGASTTVIGSPTLLYSGNAAIFPEALAVDPANGLLYVSGGNIGNSGSSGIASTWVGSTSGSSVMSLTQIFTLGPQTSGDFAYTGASSFESVPTIAASGTADYVKGGSAVAIDPGASVTDETEALLASATISIVSGLVAGDTLTVGNAGSLGASYSGGVLTLTGDASLATYQTALASITFAGTAATAGSRTIDWTVNDGLIGSAATSSTVDFTLPPPVVTAGATANFNAGDAAVTLDAGLVVTDPSSSTLASATVSITGFVSGDLLSVDTAGLAITGSYDVGTGVLTLTGNDTLIDYDAALDSVTYDFNGAHPGVGGTEPNRTIDWTVNDGAAASAAATSSLIVACYVAGTRIATQSGEVAVETLRAGDLVATGSGGARPVKWIGRRHYTAAQIAAHAQLRPVLIRRDALAVAVPCRDLRVSAMHALFIDEVFIPAAALINGVSVLRSAELGPVDYVHVELEDHDVIFADGAPAETFVDDDSRMLFDNADEYYDRFGAERARAGFAAPRIEEGFLLEAVRLRLAARAGLSVMPAAPGKLRGHVERFTDGLLQGWVMDEANPAIPVELEILVDGERVARVPANRYRTDLDHAGLAGGRCAFSVAMPASATRLGQISVHRAADGMRLPMPGAQPAWV